MGFEVLEGGGITDWIVETALVREAKQLLQGGRNSRLTHHRHWLPDPTHMLRGGAAAV